MQELENIEQGNNYLKGGDSKKAIECYLRVTTNQEVVTGSICLKLARCFLSNECYSEAAFWAVSVFDSGEDFTSWLAAADILKKINRSATVQAKRSIKLAVLNSYTTDQFVLLLSFVLARFGIAVELYTCDYGQYRQELLNPQSEVYKFNPDFIVLAVHEGELNFSEFSSDPDNEVVIELRRWTDLWEQVATNNNARIVQHNFAIPLELPFGHLACRLSGSRYSMTRALNYELGKVASHQVTIVDCERLSATYGKERWFDPKYWNLAKTALSIKAMPLLAKHTAAVIMAELGLSKKCIVLDLDNTLWGGVIGEDGLANIRLGNGADGEAFTSFQEYLLKLKDKGIILAVCSKNNDADAREPFEKHPDMRLKLSDIALFVANWNPKPDNLRNIAAQLNIGLDSLVFVDDNPMERAAVKQLLPEVDVIQMPEDPAYYIRALSVYPLLETSRYTREDRERTFQYRARSEAAALKSSASSLEDFLTSLKMKALTSPFDEIHLPRITQLINKTNQFNLTTRRYSESVVSKYMQDPNCIHFYLRLEDTFTDHGLVGLIIAFREESILTIDTWLMSCRVIGRTVENTMFQVLCDRAANLGCSHIRGIYIPTAKNSLVVNLFRDLKFSAESEKDGQFVWIYNLSKQGVVANSHISLKDKVSG